MRIAFLDHHLDNWHAKVFLKLVREAGHDVVAFETHATEGDWCAANEVRRAGSVDEAVATTDAVMVLAPDDLDAHLDLCLAAIPAGKPLWVDKLLAPTLDEALRIVRAAEYHATPLTAGSSLAFAAELEEVLTQETVEEGFFSGYGTWERYGVHTVAMALRAMGGGMKRLVNVGTPAMPTVALEWKDGRRATLVVAQGEGASQAFPWRFALRRQGAYAQGTVTRFDEFYVRQGKALLDAFENRASDDRETMLDAVRILERAPGATAWTNL